jgi:hypothetical protein
VTSHLLLVPKGRIGGVIFLLPLYAFMAWIETTLTLYWPIGTVDGK